MAAGEFEQMVKAVRCHRVAGARQIAAIANDTQPQRQIPQQAGGGDDRRKILRFADVAGKNDGERVALGA